MTDTRTYAHIVDGVVRETLATDGDIAEMFHADLVWIDITALSPQPAAGWLYDGKVFAAPAPQPEQPLAAVQLSLCFAVDRDAEAQRALYVTAGATQQAVYLQKQTQAAQALAGLAANPPMTADQGAAAFAMLKAEIGITVDPSTKAAAVDVFGVARAVAATVQVWLPLAAAIEAVRLKAKRDIGAATTPDAARAVRDAVAWPAAPTS